LRKAVILAYSGGIETTAAIPWLKEQYAADVIAVTLDLGQARELNETRGRAIGAGAVRCHVLDVRDEFARDYILPALQAEALYEERYPLGTALGRPLIAKKLVEIARMERRNHRARLHRRRDRRCESTSPRASDPPLRSPHRCGWA
jgi:argininosuccinate synthase